MTRTGLVIVVFVFVLGGCAAQSPTTTADEYFSAANENLRLGAYDMSAEQYRDLLDEYPFSEHTEEAELKIAQAHFKRGSCPEAIAAFTDFQRRHPTSPYLAFVGFLIGQCYEKQMQPADRDQSASQNAHAYYLAITQQYPDSSFSDLATEQLQHCREVMAQHEAEIAEYYVSKGNTKAGEFRLLDLVNRFNDTDAAGDALYQLGNLYQQDENGDAAALAYAAAVRHHPDTKAALRSREQLATLTGSEELPAGDTLAVLRVQSGRSRSLALAKVLDVPVPEPVRQSDPGPQSSGQTGPNF